MYTSLPGRQPRITVDRSATSFDTKKSAGICHDQVLSENTSSSPTTESGAANRVLTLATLPLYLGGFLGPFGTMMVISIYPELRESFNASTQAVNWAFSGYMIGSRCCSPCRERSASVSAVVG